MIAVAMTIAMAGGSSRNHLALIRSIRSSRNGTAITNKTRAMVIAENLMGGALSYQECHFRNTNQANSDLLCTVGVHLAQPLCSGLAKVVRADHH